MAKTLKEMIEVMEHYENGGEVECSLKGRNSWETFPSYYWDWYTVDYRIKKPKQKVTIEKWLIEHDNIKVVIETSDIDSWLKSFPTSKKLKLIESYEVEI